MIAIGQRSDSPLRLWRAPRAPCECGAGSISTSTGAASQRQPYAFGQQSARRGIIRSGMALDLIALCAASGHARIDLHQNLGSASIGGPRFLAQQESEVSGIPSGKIAIARRLRIMVPNFILCDMPASKGHNSQIIRIRSG